jgi:hypothetical protein
MGVQIKFSGKKISDQKRLVRAEQLLLARSYLRARDQIHHARWKILFMAGGAPQGEITAIRELMPKATIIAVDRDQACLDAAIEAGADAVVHCDLTDWEQERYVNRQMMDQALAAQQEAPAPIQKIAPFDLIHLDLCGGVNETTRVIFHSYRRLLYPKSVLILTFSYGRDVTEMFLEALAEFRRLMKSSHSEESQERRRAILGEFERAGIPDLLAGRLMYLFPPSDLIRIKSIMVYRGNEMPMCSCLYGNSTRSPRGELSYVQVEPGDFELAVAYPEAAKLYDCPQERIESLRRQFAALKAVMTRRAESEKTKSPSLFGDE